MYYTGRNDNKLMACLTAFKTGLLDSTSNNPAKPTFCNRKSYIMQIKQQQHILRTFFQVHTSRPFLHQKGMLKQPVIF